MLGCHVTSTQKLMSEWHDSQLQPSRNLHELLRGYMDKSNPRRKLTAEESRRLAKLEVIADKLRCEENMQNRKLQTWLSENEYAQIEEE